MFTYLPHTQSTNPMESNQTTDCINPKKRERLQELAQESKEVEKKVKKLSCDLREIVKRVPYARQRLKHVYGWLPEDKMETVNKLVEEKLNESEAVNSEIKNIYIEVGKEWNNLQDDFNKARREFEKIQKEFREKGDRIASFQDECRKAYVDYQIIDLFKLTKEEIEDAKETRGKIKRGFKHANGKKMNQDDAKEIKSAATNVKDIEERIDRIISGEKADDNDDSNTS